MRICRDALVPGGAFPLASPICASAIAGRVRHLDTGNGMDQTSFPDWSGMLTNGTGALRGSEWIKQCVHNSTGCSNALATASASTKGRRNGVDMSAEVMSFVILSSVAA